ncbi:hypothetical protein AB0J80_07420 [Actinoplanes sp. NPDC049548]|uniref:hypothetical protein n=1 Tax=Actinoplanes sp. NPDC049548 TaxID=3155152 RepID=UPI00341BD15B
MRKQLGKLMASAGALAALVGGLTVAQASPAMAGTCTTAGCGGVIRNVASRQVSVSNCWGTTATYVGAQPPCVKVVSQYKYSASWFITKGQTSTNLGKYYYDVDAWRADAGCFTKVQENGATYAYDRRGKDHLWIKINSATKDVVITSVTC